MDKWVEDILTGKEKKRPLPILTFPAIQKMGVDVPELLDNVDLQVEALSIIHDNFDMQALLGFMDLSVEAEAFGSTIIRNPGEVPTVVGAIIDEDTDVDALPVPDVHEGRTGKYIQSMKLVCEKYDDKPIIAGCIGPFSLAGRLMDVNEIMLMCYEDPDLTHAVLEKVTAFIIEYCNAFKEAGTDGVLMAEPLAGLLSPELFGEFSNDYVKRIIDAVQDESFIVGYHNCGPNAIILAEQIADNDAKLYHFGNAIQMSAVLPKMPKTSLVAGNIDPTMMFMYGTPGTMYGTTMSEMLECGVFANFLISSGCDIPPTTPWENIDAFFYAVHDYYAFGRSTIRFNQSPMFIHTRKPF